MDGEVHINGLAELNAALQAFPLQLEKKIMRGALRAGQKVILDAAKAGVPVKSGDLRDSMRISTRAKGMTVSATLKVGNKKAFYAHMVEFGTVAHFIEAKKGGALSFGGYLLEGVHHPGSQKKPFMRPAMDGSQTQALEAFASYMRTRIDVENVKMLDSLPDQNDQVAP